MWSRYQNSHQGIWYMNEIASRIVAKSGIPSDRFHLGKLILQSLKDAPDFVLQLMDYETGDEILTPNKPGELWVKGRTVFKGYYNKPEITAVTLTKNGWLKTGDILYRDEHNTYYYVDRLKMLLKYHNHHISPVEIENVILTHPGVLEVAVSGVPHVDHGELPIAFVVPNDGYTLTAGEIKDLVKNNLTDSKHLRGGVVFIDKLPKTTTGKLSRIGLKKLVLTEKIE